MSQQPSHGSNDANSPVANEMNELKLKVAALEAKNQMIEAKMEKLELKAQNRALKEDAEQKLKTKALEGKVEQLNDEFAKMQEKMAQLETAKNRGIVELKNPVGNRWDKTKTEATISKNGLKASSDTIGWMQNVFAVKGFNISLEHLRKDQQAIESHNSLYYFEVTYVDSPLRVFDIGFSNGNVVDSPIPFCWQEEKTYGFANGCDYYYFSGNKRDFEWPEGATKPEWNGIGDVIGCGILINSKNEMAIFFTGNGILMGKQIPLKLSENCLIPTLSISNVLVEANFGHNPSKPFKFDIEKCPGLDFY